MKNFLTFLCITLLALPAITPAEEPSKQAQLVVQAADDFLATLSPAQRLKVLYAFDDATQRSRWSNFPTAVVSRGGISLKQMSAPQKVAVMKLLAAVLSPMGLEKVNEIRQADDDFKANGSKRGPRRGGPGPQGPPPGGQGGPGGPGGPPPFGSPGGRGGPPPGGDLFGSDLYFISILGSPSITEPWILQFGGHHLALNITMAGDKGVLTPTLTGAQPAKFTLNGKTVRPIGRESDQALALVQSLDTEQRSKAVLAYQVTDLVLGPGQDGKQIAPEGLSAAKMNAGQQASLLQLVAEWADIINDKSASIRMQQIKADINDTWFAWSGPTAGEAGSNITAYYRIQGPHLVIEYAPQNDEPNNHVHTMYRDPTNDYGSSLVKP